MGNAQNSALLCVPAGSTVSAWFPEELLISGWCFSTWHVKFKNYQSQARFENRGECVCYASCSQPVEESTGPGGERILSEPEGSHVSGAGWSGCVHGCGFNGARLIIAEVFLF